MYETAAMTANRGLSALRMRTVGSVEASDPGSQSAAAADPAGLGTSTRPLRPRESVT